VHIYKKGRGKVAQMTKKPSEFRDVVDEIDRLLRIESGEEDEKSGDEAFMMQHMTNTTDSVNFEQIMRDGSKLSDEIMATIKEQERLEKAQKAEKSWFSFPFTF
jgi:hypothetical protein